MGIEWIVLLSVLVGMLIGAIVTLVLISLDPKVVTIHPDMIVTKKDIFERLCLIAEVKGKNPQLKFDSQGYVSGLKDGNESDDEP